MSGTDLIAAERQRQIDVEGWTPEHDAKHTGDDLAAAAACYALPAGSARRDLQAAYWPWADHFWKPTPYDRVRELVKAGALIAAEIDRLTAQQPPDSSESGMHGRCPNREPHERHWHTIRADNITVANFECRGMTPDRDES